MSGLLQDVAAAERSLASAASSSSACARVTPGASGAIVTPAALVARAVAVTNKLRRIAKSRTSGSERVAPPRSSRRSFEHFGRSASIPQTS